MYATRGQKLNPLTDNQSFKHIIKAQFTHVNRDSVQNAENDKDVLIFGIYARFSEQKLVNGSFHRLKRCKFAQSEQKVYAG